MSRPRCLCLLVLLAVAVPVAAATLTGETSKPTYNVFVRGEAAVLRFRAEGLAAGQTGVTLTVAFSDADGVSLGKPVLKVTADGQGHWEGTVAGRTDRLGYVHVTAQLSTGEGLPAVGSRQAGYMTYLVVTDPSNRVRPGDKGRFGLQGGWPTSCDLRELLGVNWVLGGYSWGWAEPDKPGQLAEKRAQEDEKTRAAREKDRRLNVMPVFCLVGGGGIPKYAQQMKDGRPVKGVIGDLKAFGDYCREVGKAATEDYAYLPRHYYQVTWEPVYPWGFEGSDEDLIRIYEAAYPALHATDPKAVVIGPTGAGISPGDLAWNERLLRKGLGKYLDAFCIHPYIGQPPEEHNLVQNVRALKEIIRSCTGRDLEIIGTEQGYPTDARQDRERQQALWLVRSAIICVGEGMKCNFSFYSCDYPGEPGYGFFHNLVIEKQAWGPGVVSPKPVAGSYAAMTMLLEDHKTVGPVEGLGPTTLGYAFERANRVTLALWDYGPTPRTVRIPVGDGPIEVCDWMGNGAPADTSGGNLTITLGPAVQYVRGVSTKLWGSQATRPLTLKSSTLTALVGDKVTLPVTLTPPAGAGGAVTLTLSGGEDRGLPTVTQKVTAKSGTTTVPLAISLPATAQAGALPLRLTAQTGQQVWGTTSLVLRLNDPLSLEGVRPLGGQRLAVHLHNYRSQSLKGKLTARLRGVPEGAAQADFVVPAGESGDGTLAFPQANLEPGRDYTVELTARPERGLPITRLEHLAFTDVPRAPADLRVDGDLGDWAGVPEVAVEGRARLVRQPQLYRGLADLGASLRLAWDDRALYLAATVRDDHFVQEQTGFNTWKGDCLQVGLDTLPGRQGEATGNLLADNASRGNTELDLALTSKGPEAYRTITFDPTKLPVRLLDGKEAQLAVKAVPGGLVYEAALPWTSLGRTAAPPADRQLGFALAVNDLDSPDQLDPKAIGLFGGICPVKDPAQFGRLVLVSEAVGAVSRPRPSGAWQLQGALGQSQAADAEALPWTGAAGVTRQADSGDLWAVAGDRVYHLSRDGKLLESLPLPGWVRLARGDGKRLVTLDDQGNFYEFDLARKAARKLFTASAEGGKYPAELALGRDGTIFGLYRAGLVRQWDAAGKATDRLTLPPGNNWDYRALGCDPETGDLWVGTYYPDMKLLRFAAGDKTPREVKEGFATFLASEGGGLWWLDNNGVGKALRPGSCQPPQGDFTGYPSGVAADRDGSWVACAQGLVQFDAAGRPTGHRVGGLGDLGLVSVNAAGSVLVMLENSQRFGRLWADDAPDAPLCSNSNEPWRVAGGWSGKAVGLADMGDGALVLDATSKALWRYDPDHVAWAEKPWIRLTNEGALSAPRLLAVGPARAFVLDGPAVQAFWLSDFTVAPTTWPLPASLNPETLVALAVSEDEQLLCAATAQSVTAVRPDGSVAWEVPSGWQRVAGLAVSGPQVLVADRGAGSLSALAVSSGERTTVIESDAVPGGLEPAALAARGPWLFVSDVRGHRVLRFGRR